MRAEEGCQNSLAAYSRRCILKNLVLLFSSDITSLSAHFAYRICSSQQGGVRPSGLHDYAFSWNNIPVQHWTCCRLPATAHDLFLPLLLAIPNVVHFCCYESNPSMQSLWSYLTKSLCRKFDKLFQVRLKGLHMEEYRWLPTSYHLPAVH